MPSLQEVREAWSGLEGDRVARLILIRTFVCPNVRRWIVPV